MIKEYHELALYYVSRLTKMSLPLKTWMHENPDSRHLCWQKNMGSRDQMRPKHKLRTVTNFKRKKSSLLPLKVWVLLQLLYATILKLDSRIHTYRPDLYAKHPQCAPTISYQKKRSTYYSIVESHPIIMNIEVLWLDRLKFVLT